MAPCLDSLKISIWGWSGPRWHWPQASALRASAAVNRCRVWHEVHEPREPSRLTRPTPVLGQVSGVSLPSSIRTTVPWQVKQPATRSKSLFMPLFSQGSIFQMISMVLACLDFPYCLASSGWQREQSLGVTTAVMGTGKNSFARPLSFFPYSAK
jgi:hypothetical protein